MLYLSKNIILIMFVAFSGAYVVPKVLDIIYRNINNYKQELEKLDKVNDVEVQQIQTLFSTNVKAGKWIGILERILILVLLFTNCDVVVAVGLVISIKTLVRFQALNNKIFSEYYLLGTMISVIYTIVLYGVVRYF